MIKLLLDQGLAPQAASLLRSKGWTAIHVSEIGMAKAQDAQILDKARNDGMVCVTLDHDFHMQLALSSNAFPSVILLRVQQLDSAGQADLIQYVCTACEKTLLEGAAISSDGASIRIRRLPLR